jgi:hypothetical protein
MSTESFTNDVFLSHSAKDKAAERLLAQQLRKDGLKVWFDGWEIKPGDNISVKIEAGRERQHGVTAKGVPANFSLWPLIDQPG